MYMEIHGISRSIRLHQAKCILGYQEQNFCNRNNIDTIEAPANDRRAIGLVERLIQTNKNRLAFIKEEKSDTNSFHIMHALKTIVHQLRIDRSKTTKISPFEAQFGRKSNTPLRVICTTPKLSNLSYENIIN